MSNSKLIDNTIIVLAILAVFSVMRCSVESEVKIPDSELVKCIEKKVLSGEIHQIELDPIFFETERWEDDSTIIIDIVTNSSYDTPSTAHIKLMDPSSRVVEGVQLTKHESDRIVEITNKQRDKLAKTQEKLEKKKQDSLRIELIKNCK